MFTLIVLAIYTVLVLLFVPLEKIADFQKKVKAQAEKLKNKMNS